MQTYTGFRGLSGDNHTQKFQPTRNRNYELKTKESARMVVLILQSD